MKVEKIYGTGCKEQPQDNRDYVFRGITDFDWEFGFDLEKLLGYRKQCKSYQEFMGEAENWSQARYKEIILDNPNIEPFKIPVKDQNGSSSCVSQALSYYLSALNMIETGQWVDISARDCYAYIKLYGGGAYLRDACKLAVKRGISLERLVPSYHKDGRPYDEEDYKRPKETDEIKKWRVELQSKEYRANNDSDNMDNFAKMILKGYGAFSGVSGANGKGWRTYRPSPPDTYTKMGRSYLDFDWQHALFFIGAGIDENGKYVEVINSWGEKTGNKGKQRIYKNYFGVGGVFNSWTLIDKLNIMELKNDHLYLLVEGEEMKSGVCVGGKLMIGKWEDCLKVFYGRTKGDTKDKVISVGLEDWNSVTHYDFKGQKIA